MSITGISSSSQLSALQTNYQTLRSEFSQLGQDLSAGDLTKAQTDFVTLSQAAGSQFGTNSPIAKALGTIGQALQSGDLSTAQQAFSTMQSQMVSPSAVSHHSHTHRAGGNFTSELAQLGQALQSGNLSAAQQAFSVLQQTWQAASASVATTSPVGTINSVNVSA